MKARFQRLSAFAAVFVYLAGTGAGLLHEATVEHVRCAEHGQLEDRATRPAPTAGAPDSPWDVLSSAPKARDGEVHAHCGVPDALERPRTFAAIQRPPPPPAPIVFTQAPAASRAPTAVALFRLAPKQSPPL